MPLHEHDIPLVAGDRSLNVIELTTSSLTEAYAAGDQVWLRAAASGGGERESLVAGTIRTSTPRSALRQPALRSGS
jgi:hypothetical protein